MDDNNRQEDQITQAEDKDSLEIIVDPGQSPLRLDKFLIDKLPQVSRSRVQAGIKSGEVTVDSKTVKPNHKVSPGEVIKVVYPKSKAPDHVIPEAMELDIRYEDDALMIIHKPPGLVVHPGVGNPRGTLVNGLVHYFKSIDLPVMEGNLPDRPGLVHRIDKDTSGLLVIAKTAEALNHLSNQFAEHTIQRQYLGIVWGEMPEEEGTINMPIGRDPRHRVKHTAFPEEDMGKHAITHYKVLESLYYVSLVQFHLETGRTHQIRVHTNYLGNPIFSDSLYGGDKIMKGTVFTKYKQFVQNCFKVCPRQALHARSIGFIHPSTNEKMFFEAEMPDDMQQLWDKWKHYVQYKKDPI